MNEALSAVWRVMAILGSFGQLLGGADIMSVRASRLVSAGVHVPPLVGNAFAILHLLIPAISCCVLVVGVPRKAEGSAGQFVRRYRLLERLLVVLLVMFALDFGFNHYCDWMLSTANHAHNVGLRPQ